MGYCFVEKVLEIIQVCARGFLLTFFPTFLDLRVIQLRKNPLKFIISIDTSLWKMSRLILTHKSERNRSFGSYLGSSVRITK